MALAGVGALGGVVAGGGSRSLRRTIMPPAIESRQITDKAPARPRKFIYGRTRAEGTMVFAHQTTERIALTATASLTAKVLHLIVAFADHEITAFDEVMFDNEVIPLESDGAVTAGHRLAGWVWVSQHLGADDQPADAALIAAAGGKWTAADRLRGVAYLYVRLVLISAKFPNRRPPNITAVIRGAKPFDPRSHVTAYTANAALCLRDYLYNRRFGLKAAALYSAGSVSLTNGSPVVTSAGSAYLANVLPGDQFDVVGDGVWYDVQSVDSDTQLTLSSNYVGSTASARAYAISSEVDEAGAAAAADICDQAVSLAGGGTEARYEANGLLSSRDAPNQLIEAFRSAMAGDLIQTGGKWLILPGAYGAPTISLGDDDLHDIPDAGLRRSRVALFNRLRGVFISPDHLWQKTDLPPMTDAAFVSQDGGEDIESSLFFPLTTSAPACQRIMRIMLRRVREQETVSLRVKTKGLSLRAGDHVAVTNGRMGWTNKVFRVLRLGLGLSADGFSVALSLVAETAGVYDWTAEEAALEALPTVTLPAPFTKFDRLDLRVSGLELDNGLRGNTTEFVGSSAGFMWRDNAQVESFELGGEPGGVGSGARDSNFRDWEVRILDVGGAPRRVEYVTVPAFLYGIAKNRADGNGAPLRSFAIEVRTRTVDGQISKLPARLVVGNPAPRLPVAFTVEGADREVVVKDIALAANAPDPDQQGLAVWLSQSSGFTPSNSTLVYRGAISTVSVTALADTQYYLRLAFFDAFGLDGLNLSAEQSVLTGSDLNVTLADAAIVAWDLSAATFAVVTIAGDRALAISSLRAGTFILKVVQGSGGGHALSYPGAVKFPGGSAPDHSTGAAGDVDIVTFISDGVNFYAVAQKDFS